MARGPDRRHVSASYLAPHAALFRLGSYVLDFLAIAAIVAVGLGLWVMLP